MNIQCVTSETLQAAGEHLRRHMGESGRDDDVLFAPYGPGSPPFDVEGFVKRTSPLLDAAIETAMWKRFWGLFTDDGLMVGHVNLGQDLHISAAHRATLGIGLERPWRGRGHGRRLMEIALAFAREAPALAWVDLGVFANNPGAIALYESLGFVEVGRVADRLRVGETQIEDIQMVLGV